MKKLSLLISVFLCSAPVFAADALKCLVFAENVQGNGQNVLVEVGTPLVPYGTAIDVMRGTLEVHALLREKTGPTYPLVIELTVWDQHKQKFLVRSRVQGSIRSDAAPRGSRELRGDILLADPIDAAGSLTNWIIFRCGLNLP